MTVSPTRRPLSGKTNGDLADRDTNGRFQSGNRVNPNGRPKGSKNKATQVREELLGPILPEAVEELHKAVRAGERWAVETVISYCLAKPKPVDQKWTPKIGQCYKVESGLIKRIPKHG